MHLPLNKMEDKMDNQGIITPFPEKIASEPSSDNDSSSTPTDFSKFDTSSGSYQIEAKYVIALLTALYGKKVVKKGADTVDNEKLLETYIHKVDEEQRQLRSDMRASEERTSKQVSESEKRTSERIAAIEERMDDRLNRIEDLISKGNDCTDNLMKRMEDNTNASISKLSDDIKDNSRHIQQISVSVIAMAVATVLSVVALVIGVFFSIDGIVKDAETISYYQTSSTSVS